jgi:hypothetical protein
MSIAQPSSRGFSRRTQCRWLLINRQTAKTAGRDDPEALAGGGITIVE